MSTLVLTALIVLGTRSVNAQESTEQIEQIEAETVETGAQEKIVNRTNRLDFESLWVFSAGIHKFENDHLHPGRQAVVYQDLGLIKSLIKQGVKNERIVALLDQDASRENCRSKLAALLQGAKEGDSLLVFAHSHGSAKRGGLICTYETGGVWEFADLIQIIENNFKGSKACICVCACHSGSLIDQIRSMKRRVSYFCISSVHDDVNALTVATADFEACVRDAFSGSACPDLNRDGVITFKEFALYLTKDQSTLFGTVPDYGWTENFDPEMIITDAAPRTGPSDCCLVRLKNGERGRVIREEAGRLLVRGSKNPNLVRWINVGSPRRLAN